MITINTNLSSLIAQKSLLNSTTSLNEAIERMTTGFKINHAKDNAANYSISTDMTTKIGAYNVAEENVSMSLDMLTTASESLSQIEKALTRLRDLATQASNGTYGEQSKNAINAEANALVDEIERLQNTSEYNGINLAKGQVAGSESSKFIKEIDRRDTSKMKKFEEVNENEVLTSGTYSISTADELEKLARMTNDGKIGEGTEFVLANDIDLGHIANWTPIGIYAKDANGKLIEELAFRATFDGNGYKIKGLKINATEDFKGLFSFTYYSTIANLGIDEFNINSNKRFVGCLIGDAQYSTISNCYGNGTLVGGNYSGGLIGYSVTNNIEDSYTTGSVSASSENVGGLVGSIDYSTVIKNCFSEANVSGVNAVGGLVGNLSSTSSIFYSFATGDVTSSAGCAGSLLGRIAYSYTKNSIPITVENCYATGTTSGSRKGFIGDVISSVELSGKLEIKDCYYKDTLVARKVISNSLLELNEENNKLIDADTKLFTISNNAICKIYNSLLDLQVGVDNDDSSRIGVEVGNDIGSVSAFRRIGIESGNYLSMLDNLLSQVTSKQTEYGAAQNRLYSALDEITIQRENLVSSRSTIRDTDVAEESSRYIQNQILQQASATLLSTANQTPSIALQLI